MDTHPQVVLVRPRERFFAKRRRAGPLGPRAPPCRAHGLGKNLPARQPRGRGLAPRAPRALSCARAFRGRLQLVMSFGGDFGGDSSPPPGRRRSARRSPAPARDNERSQPREGDSPHLGESAPRVHPPALSPAQRHRIVSAIDPVSHCVTSHLSLLVRRIHRLPQLHPAEQPRHLPLAVISLSP